ncbi:MAG: TIGR00296 family protein [Candidatus Hodarchaeales archaeon]|jgi:uncharacterized protein (TIGR00296 family)
MSYSGEYLVKLARRTIETYLKEKVKIKIPKDTPKDLFDQSGAFVTLHRVHRNSDEAELRGCIGRIESPNSSLIQSTIDSAIDAAIHDPRFPPVKFEEMVKIKIEVTILTIPKVLEVKDPSEYFDLIKIGKDGLIAEKGRFQRGLLLPQVPVEQKWDLNAYLDYVCMKAGLSSNAWKDLETKISSFEGLIFSEESPNGNVFQKIIS